MNQKLISKAISNIDDVYIEESFYYPADDFDHPPERTKSMENKKVNTRKIIGLVLAACLIFTLAVTAYAADIGGIQRIMQIWLHGELTTAVLEIQDGQYSVTDEDGTFIMGGGGVAIEPDGSERPLSEQEILHHLDSPDLVHNVDGTVWVYFHDQKINITNRFNAAGYCYLKLQNGNEVIYATIDRNGGMATSPIDYPQPGEFLTPNE